MNSLKKIVGINLIILIIYSVYCISFVTRDNGMLLALYIVSHAMLTFIIAILCALLGNKEEAKAFSLSCGLVLLIGFSTCTSAGAFPSLMG